MLPEVLPLRQASRELVRELGFLHSRDPSTKLSHSHAHVLVEVEAGGRLAQADLPALLRLDKSQTSRIVAELEARGWLRAEARAGDRRARVLVLTPRGRAKVADLHAAANARVEQALATLGAAGRRAVVDGLRTYARALERARRSAAYLIRPIRPADRDGVASLIRTVMPEFGARGPGFAIQDPEVDDMFTAYRPPRARYWVVVSPVRASKIEPVVGGAGYAALVGGDARTCELRKMYFLPEARGLGIGQKLLDLCTHEARREGFTRMYLETLASMTQARALYERNGFRRLKRPLGDTGHYGCNAFYSKDLR